MYQKLSPKREVLVKLERIRTSIFPSVKRVEIIAKSFSLKVVAFKIKSNVKIVSRTTPT